MDSQRAALGRPFADGHSSELFVTELSSDNVITALRSVLEAEFADAMAARWREHEDFWGGDKPGTYTVVGVYCQVFVDAAEPLMTPGADVAPAGVAESVSRVLRVVEELMERGSREARGLVVVGFLEGVQNIALNRGLELSAVERHLGARGRRGWDWLHRIWMGRSTLASVIRDEVRGELEEPDW